MKITCPKCKNEVPSDQVNMGTDLAYCPDCDEGFTISEYVENRDVDKGLLDHPPKGTWFRDEEGEIVIGGTTRSGSAIFFILVMFCWGIGSMWEFYVSQIINGKFDLGLTLGGIPFLIGTIVLIAICLNMLYGRVEVRIGAGSYVFTGVGRLGRTKRFEWSEIETINYGYAGYDVNDVPATAIVLKGKKEVKFGSRLSPEQREYVLNMLRYLKFGPDLG